VYNLVKSDLSILPHTGDNIFMEIFSCEISEDDFLGRFGESDLTFTSLSQNSNITSGWLQQFTAWNESGILPH